MLVLASATAVSAQDAPKRRDVPRGVKAPKPQRPDTPAPNVENQPPPDAPVPPGAPTPVRLQFPNSDVVDVLHLYEQLTGKKLVMDNFVQGKVNIFIAKDVSRDEAIKIIEMSMALNAVVSVLFKLQYADPQELQQVLMAYFQGSSGTINILALPKSSSLLVTQNADIIRQLAGVIEQIDVAPAEVVSEFIKLERADASKVVDMLKDIFEKGTETGQPGVRSVMRYISAGDVLPVLVQALTEPGTEGEGAGAGAVPGGAPGQSPQPRQQQRGTSSYTGGQGALGGSSSTATGGGSTINISEELPGGTQHGHRPVATQQ